MEAENTQMNAEKSKLNFLRIYEKILAFPLDNNSVLWYNIMNMFVFYLLYIFGGQF